jgi:hypothetical protein
LKNFGAAACVLGDEAAGLPGEVKQDGARLEQRDRRAAARWFVVDNCGNAVVRRDLEELGRELLALADIHFVNAVREARLFQEDGDLVPVRRGPVVEIDHDADLVDLPP